MQRIDVKVDEHFAAVLKEYCAYWGMTMGELMYEAAKQHIHSSSHAVSISLCAEQVCTKTNGKLMMNISTYLKNIQRYAHVVPVRHEKDTSTDAR